MKKNVKQRRANAKIRLEKQLAAGTKTAKKSTNKVPLTEQDIKRINKDIAILSGKPIDNHHSEANINNRD